MLPLSWLTGGQCLRRDAHGLSAFEVDEEDFVDCLILNLNVRLDVTEADAAGWIVRGIANHAERQGSGHAAEHALVQHVL